MKPTHTLIDAIGNTPLVELTHLPKNGRVFVKLENLNPTSSVKARIAKSMVLGMLERKEIVPGKSTLVEPTSGNTGIGLAAVCTSLGIDLKICMPDSMSIERRNLMKALGATLVLTEGSEGMVGAIKAAQRIVDEDSEMNHHIVGQFRNPDNPKAHRLHTGVEILTQMSELGLEPTHIVAGVGTGGTITGVAQAIIPVIPDVKIIAVEPDTSAVLSGSAPGPHGIQGIGAGFVPAVLDRSLITAVRTTNAEAARAMARELALKEGILGGISAGANVAVALSVAEETGGNVVTFICDTGERYLSTGLFE
eukprot:gnl/Dysnectes_brevis/1073_a1197_4604.p1 GENE.gnl/Dysnectes_brevis/1073_a1197_4604~~gnl/Dysnectes_brevis/1073_a1197_4604.p1  ORF type:complete len:321 (-),score=43.77 gnl/Dysnectes_brevis/1073_a1197_4604:42-965(-)